MRIHLIATGGAVMHNLALALHQNGHIVTGSDDEIYNPAKDRLAAAGLLPDAFGWFAEKIVPELDFCILGMHARANNPELTKALDSGVQVFSFPEFIYRHAKNKTRVVVAGSHGKTTTTAIILHVLQKSNHHFDYLVGAQLDGFDTMVKLSDAPIMVIEGDEYLSSPIDRRAKFLHYRPHIAIITGIAWDHINVFPTFEAYRQQFELLLENMEPGGKVIYFENDPHLPGIVSRSRAAIETIPYAGLTHTVVNGKTQVKRPDGSTLPLEIFGDHNLQNLHAAMIACEKLGISEPDFLEAVADFKGAAKRLQLLAEQDTFSAWLDFAHAPSKVQATVQAVKKLYPQRRLVACFELHTFSSLNKEFLPHYAGTMDAADLACVFYNPHTLDIKKMPPIEPEDIRSAFTHANLHVFTEKTALEAFLKNVGRNDTNLLLMSSGNFGGMDAAKIWA
jgi:UDP-N-acetylmuramate: L-alanyl-gamma-D-glutamyl-meso-diaminopimelate ligase